MLWAVSNVSTVKKIIVVFIYKAKPDIDLMIDGGRKINIGGLF